VEGYQTYANGIGYTNNGLALLHNHRHVIDLLLSTQCWQHWLPVSMQQLQRGTRWR
jgi:hypothetical protein